MVLPSFLLLISSFLPSFFSCDLSHLFISSHLFVSHTIYLILSHIFSSHTILSHLLSFTLILFDRQYENWKIRETARLMRDAEQREMAALEKADLERRRLMTDEQRISEDKRLGKYMNFYSHPYSYFDSTFFLFFFSLIHTLSLFLSLTHTHTHTHTHTNTYINSHDIKQV